MKFFQVNAKENVLHVQIAYAFSCLSSLNDFVCTTLGLGTTLTWRCQHPCFLFERNRYSPVARNGCTSQEDDLPPMVKQEAWVCHSLAQPDLCIGWVSSWVP